MIKFVKAIVLLNAIYQCVNGLCEYTTQNRCNSDNKCKWNAKIQCIDSVNCTSLSQNECVSKSECTYILPENETCFQKKFNCQLLDKEKCQNQKDRCSLKINKRCTQKTNYEFPKCNQMNHKECLLQSNYCDVTGQCQENDTLCEANNRESCESKGVQCKFQTFQNPKCVQKPDYCLTKSERECNITTNCKLNSEDSSCKNQQNCQFLDREDCKKKQNYCTLVENIPAECISRGQPCFKIFNRTQCEQELNCYFDENTKSCWFQNECHFLNPVNCMKFQHECKYISPKPYICLNKQLCNQLSNYECEQNQNFCKYSPPKSFCKIEKNICDDLSIEDCKNQQEQCNIQEEIGYCFVSKGFDCIDLNPNECSQKSECDLENFKCIQKPLQRCESLTNEECSSEDHCYLQEEYSCVDFSITCPTNYKDCQENPLCEWLEGSKFACKNLVQCSQFTHNCPINNGCKLLNQGCIYMYSNSI